MFVPKIGIYITAEHFEYFIDRKKTAFNGVKVPDKAIMVTMKDAGKE